MNKISRKIEKNFLLDTFLNNDFKWRLIISSMLITTIAAYIIAYFTHNEYQSRALIQNGHYSCIAKEQEKITEFKFCEIESMLILKERLISKSFHKRITNAFLNNNTNDQAFEKMFNSLKLVEYKDGTAIQISISGPNKNLTQLYMEKIVTNILNEHELKITPLIDSYSAQLNYVTQRINDLVSKSKTNDSEFNKLKDTQFNLQRILNFGIQKSKIIEEVSTTNNPFTDYAKIFIEIGIVLGFFIGALASQLKAPDN